MISLRISRDLALNKALYARGLPGDPWVGDHHTFWIARDADGEPVGFCSAVYMAWEQSVFLSSAVVFRAARGRGLQRRMIRTRVAWARRRGAECVLTYTVEHNWPSAYNLLREGFRHYDARYAWVGKAWYFRKLLT